MVIDCLYFYLKLVSRRSWPTEPKTSRALQSTGEWHLGFHKVRGEALRTRGRPHPTMKRNASKCEWSIIYEGKTCSNHHVFLFGSNTTRRKGGGGFLTRKEPTNDNVWSISASVDAVSSRTNPVFAEMCVENVSKFRPWPPIYCE